jgi:hypothetical protein
MVDKPLICTVCNGSMEPYTGPRYSRRLGAFLILAGIFCIFFWIGAVLGLPLFFIGMYMTGAKRQLWVCKDCRTAIERIELKTVPKRATKSAVPSANNK